MTEQSHHDPAALDAQAEAFTILANTEPASESKRKELIDKPAFGQVFSDHMSHISWTKGEGWSDRRVEPYAPLRLDPGASVLHYAQEVFEGLKAYRHSDGSTWLFSRMPMRGVSRIRPSVCTFRNSASMTSSLRSPPSSSRMSIGFPPVASTPCTCVPSCSPRSLSSVCVHLRKWIIA